MSTIGEKLTQSANAYAGMLRLANSVLEPDKQANNLAAAVETLINGYGQGGGGQNVGDVYTITPPYVINDSSKYNSQIQVNGNVLITFVCNSMPSADGTNYYALCGMHLYSNNANQRLSGHIIRPNGTMGTDGTMVSVENGFIVLKGQYGMWFPELTYTMIVKQL